jgi:putative aldouronate transport system substrate-binding protein
MKKMALGKKVLSATLVAAMATGMLAGCGSSKDGAKETATETTDTATTDTAKADAGSKDTAAADGKTVINVYRDSFNLTSPDTDEVAKIEQAINDYIGGKINVQIKLTDIGNAEYKDKANLALSNNEINLLWTASWMETINTDNLVKQNAVYDLTDIIKDSTLYKSIPDWVWGASSYNGKNYFVSCYKESAEGYNLMFRQDLVDKYKWDLSKVKTLKDIEPMLADCKKEGLKYPFLTQKTAMFHRFYLNDFDFITQDSLFAVDRKTNEVVNPVQTAQYKEFCDLMSNWGEKGYVSEDDVTKTTTDTTTQTQDWGISWWTSVPNNDEASTRYKQKVTMAPVTDCFSHSTTTLGSCFAVTANSTEEQAKACVDFLGLLYTDKTLADLYTYGLKGTDYDVDAKGQVVKKGDMYNHSAWESCNVLNLSLETGEPENKVELYKNFNDASTPSCASGFRFDKSNIEDKYAACTNVFDEFGFPLENGGSSPADVDKQIEAFQKALDEAGYQDILAEAQKQYNDWKATK